MKITFLGAGSTIFVRNIIGDCMCTPSLRDSEFALYDIDAERLKESLTILEAIQKGKGGVGRLTTYCGVENRKEALRGASFVVNAIQVGLYEPCTVTDFEVPKKFGLRQTIGDTLGIGGIMRALRTIPVMEDFTRDMEEVCPDALFLNYTNPMAMLSGYLQRYTPIRTIGLCHSVQSCSSTVLAECGMEDRAPGRRDLIAGINHMAWLLKIYDKDGNDLYPEIRRRAPEKLAEPDFKDKVRFEYIRRLGYFCTESSEHNAEYNPYFIKPGREDLIEKYNIPLDEYPRRCIKQIADWKDQYAEMCRTGVLEHERSHEYGSYIMDAIVSDQPYKFGGNLINRGAIENLPQDACVEVPCLADGTGIHATIVGALPEQLAALNRTNINPQLLTIEAAHTRKRETVYQAAMLDPHTAAQLDPDQIVAMVDALIAAHGDWLPKFH